MRRSAVRIISFIIILTLFLFGWMTVLKFKYDDGIYDMTRFYELEDDSVDVLILGSSHAFESFDTGAIWDEYGIASYVLAGSSQPMWNTYYYLKEALKTQSPKLIILEAFGVTYDFEYSDTSTVIKNNYGLKWSYDKYKSLKVSVPPEKLREYIPEFVQYHSRYRELGRGDFSDNKGEAYYDDWMGFVCDPGMWELTHNDVSSVTESEPLFAKTEEYYRLVMGLAKERGIPVVVMIAPYAGVSEEDQRQFNCAAGIAEELGVPFVNCNLLDDETKLDYTKDVADPGHLNFRGSMKFTSFVGEYIKGNYDIPDRKGDDRYAPWERQADVIRQKICDLELKETNDIERICEILEEPDYWTFVSVDGSAVTSDPEINRILMELGIKTSHPNGIWYINEDGPIWDTGMDDRLDLRTGRNDFSLQRICNDSGEYENRIMIDRIGYSKVENGINIVVYDTINEEVADTIGIDANDDYKVVR